ncbi:SPOR domain-containing protein [Vibrio metoecus]|uniref:Sporulation protein n=1 Tax=Vibrio metoecus TaxID=1481663 RepID=A0ABR4RZ48_VIBMT|nr:SPOR domain-containing protein [Vibrio metoecus]KDO14991.1 sporulation protein [Vibrio metoecus]KQA98489.1 sporulation protein [Vibrio metoecus]PAR54928.1 SPOR domain-containing protein [Vibrio metoecus]PAR70013.1 SPOR domain-containing protein [Vibrio metoecus]
MPKWILCCNLSAALLLLSPIALAANSEYLCDAQQAAVNQLPVLDATCPIGDGLWGKKPKRGDSLFWIQCGMLSKPMPLATVKSIYEHISTDIWVKPEPKGARCLIGPYTDFELANKELKKVKKLATFEQAFIRQVVKTSAQQPVMKAKPAAAASTTTVVASEAEMKKPVSTPKVEPKPEPIATVTKPVAKLNSTPKPSGNNSFVLRQQVKVGSQTFALPYSDNPKVQFYMEHDQAWNRLDYDAAQIVCRDLGMRLATEQEWSALLQSKQMQQHQWPVQLPYWGEGRKGMFTTGKVNVLKGSSLLNVVCVK